MSETSTYRNIIYRLLPGSRDHTARRLAGQAGALPLRLEQYWRSTMTPLRRRRPTERNLHRTSSRSARSSPGSATKHDGFANTPSPSPGTCSSTRPMRGRRPFRGDRQDIHASSPATGRQPYRFTTPRGRRPFRDDMISIPRVGPMRIRREGGRARIPRALPVKARDQEDRPASGTVTVCYEVEAEERSRAPGSRRAWT